MPRRSLTGSISPRYASLRERGARRTSARLLHQAEPECDRIAVAVSTNATRALGVEASGSRLPVACAAVHESCGHVPLRAAQAVREGIRHARPTRRCASMKLHTRIVSQSQL